MTRLPHQASDSPNPEERLLQAHLASELDGHLGSARRRFEAAVAGPSSALPRPIRLHEHRTTAWNWRWSLGLVAAAASVALLIGLWGLFEAAKPVQPVGELAEGTGRLTPLEYSESWEAQDLGTYEFDGRPVRAVHHQQWEKTRYRNPSGYEVQIEEPRSRLVLVDAPVQ